MLSYASSEAWIDTNRCKTSSPNTPCYISINCVVWMLFVAKVFESFEQSGLVCVCVCGDGPENIALSVCVRYASYCGILVGIINNTSNMWLLVTCVASSASTDKTKKRNRCWTAIKSNEIVVRYFGALVFSRLHATKMRRALWKMRISAVSSACFLSTHSRRENRIVYPIKYVYYDMMVCIRHHCDILLYLLRHIETSYDEHEQQDTASGGAVSGDQSVDSMRIWSCPISWIW